MPTANASPMNPSIPPDPSSRKPRPSQAAFDPRVPRGDAPGKASDGVPPGRARAARSAGAVAAEPSRSWWREPWMWLVVGGPAVVVVAAIATAVIAHRGADVVMAPDPAARRAEQLDPSHKPAVKARNQAAEIGIDAAREAAVLREAASDSQAAPTRPASPADASGSPPR